jgi:hypothetical protein
MSRFVRHPQPELGPAFSIVQSVQSAGTDWTGLRRVVRPPMKTTTGSLVECLDWTDGGRLQSTGIYCTEEYKWSEKAM